MCVAQLFWTLCDPKDCSPPASSVHGILQEGDWSGLSFPSPGDLPDPDIESESPALQSGSLPSETPRKPLCTLLLVLLYQPHLRASGIRSWRLGTAGLKHKNWPPGPPPCHLLSGMVCLGPCGLHEDGATSAVTWKPPHSCHRWAMGVTSLPAWPVNATFTVTVTFTDPRQSISSLGHD